MIYKYQLLSLLLWMLLISSNIHSKEFPYVQFENYTHENGLPDNVVHQTVKDKSGFIWIGTADGLIRYSGGTDFKEFRHYPDNPNTPAGNQIKCLLVDSENNLWIGTQENGVSCYNIGTSTYTHFPHNKSNPNTLSNKETLSLMEDSQGRIWVGTENGLNVIDKQTGYITRFYHNSKDTSSLSAPAVLSILEDSQERIWVGTWGGGLNLLIPSKEGIKGSTFKHFKNDPIYKESISGNNVWSLFEDSQQRIWVGTFVNGLNLMIPSLNYKNLEEFSAQFITYKNNPKDQKTISNNAIYSINEDKSGYPIHILIYTLRLFSKRLMIYH